MIKINRSKNSQIAYSLEIWEELPEEAKKLQVVVPRKLGWEVRRTWDQRLLLCHHKDFEAIRFFF